MVTAIAERRGAGQPQRFVTATEFLHSLDLSDQINLFRVMAYLERSQLAQKVHGFSERAAAQLAKKQAATAADSTAAESSARAFSTHIPALQSVESFLAALLNPDVDGRVGVVVPDPASSTAPYFKYLLLNPTEVFAPVLTAARSVVLAGGTMEPFDEFQRELLGGGGGDNDDAGRPGASPGSSKTTTRVPVREVVRFQCGHVIPPTSILAVAVGAGPSGGVLDFTFASRGTDATISELGRTFVELCRVLPAGVVAFFASYAYLSAVSKRWGEMGILRDISKKKKIFIEPEQSTEVEPCLAAYSAAISGGNRDSPEQ
ncbi:DEAD H (Asp-Glu-Ala-Asp His) box helicase 11, partial [Cladochytrium tenue]